MTLLMGIALVVAADAQPKIAAAVADQHGVLVHEVQSPYQAGTTQIRVLLPERRKPGQRLPCILVLPVEAGREHRYGDGLDEVRMRNLHNLQMAVFVAPTFSHLPWYADHPADPTLRQESYLLKVVLPFVSASYPVSQDANGRHLLGFSKSGWGAYSLLLRHPHVFGKAVAWDAPLMMDRPGQYGSGPIFGTRENFERYRITKLLQTRAEELQTKKRLLLTGYGSFRAQHQQAHHLMTERKIAHDERDGPARKHDWHSGWVADSVAWLLAENGQ